MGDSGSQGGSVVPGFAIFGILITGIAGIIHSFIFAEGMGLLAAAVAFGIMLHVSFR